MILGTRGGIRSSTRLPPVGPGTPARMETMPIYDSVVEDLAIDPDSGDTTVAPEARPHAPAKTASKSRTGQKNKNTSTPA